MDSSPPPPEPPPEQVSLGAELPRGMPWLAWVVILALASLMVWDANRAAPAEAAGEGSNPPQAMIGRILVGVRAGLDPADQAKWSELLLGQASPLQDGTSRDQLAYAILVAEFNGPQAGLDELNAGKGADDASQPESPPSDLESDAIAKLRGQVRSIFEALAAGRPVSIDTDDRQRLQDELGWYGRLAPLIEGTPDQTGRAALLKSVERVPWALAGVGVWYLACGLTGLVALIVLLVGAVTNHLRHGLSEPSPCSGVYAECFATWLAVFVLVRYAVIGNLPTTLGHFNISINLAGMILATVLALGWGVFRGIPWRRMRQDLGLEFGSRPLGEIGAGVVIYCIALPMLLLGALLVIALTLMRERLSPGSPMPSHPAQEALMDASWVTVVQIMILGAIIAPLVEETMFRGALYRQLRDATRGAGFANSALFSALVTSVLFAAIHPQGWVFIPALASLAFAFCIGREWRGRLPACMIAHGITNFITLSLNVLLFA